MCVDLIVKNENQKLYFDFVDNFASTFNDLLYEFNLITICCGSIAFDSLV